ncbi:MAG: tetratricopeptide repeat protein [Phycisphaerae bacterium]|nr:tetratricopeptide repeat protein [Phycisphaerae bacterium]
MNVPDQQPTIAAEPARAGCSSSLIRREHLLLGLVFLLALGMRLWHLSGQASHNPMFNTPTLDEGQHDEWARLIASGAGLGAKPFFRAPLYYYALAGLYAIAGPNVAVARFLGCVIGALSCYLIARMGAALGGFRTGLVAGLIAAVYWPMIYFDDLLLTVVLEVFFNTLMLLLLVYAMQRKSAWLFFMAGIVWGLSAITRPTVLTIAPLMLLWVWFGSGGKWPRLRGFSNALLVLAGAVLVIAPVTIRNRVVGGEWALIATSGGINFCMGNNPESDGMSATIPGLRSSLAAGTEDWRLVASLELGHMPTEQEASRYWGHRAVEWITSDPAAWAKLLMRKFRLFWSPVEITNNMPIRFFAGLSPSSALYWIGFPIVACLGLAGLVSLRGSWRLWLLPVLFMVATMLTVIAFFCPGRFRLPAAPVLILLTAQGLVWLPGVWRRRSFRELGAYVGIACLAAIFLATNPPERRPYLRHNTAMGHFNMSVAYRNELDDDPTLIDKVVEELRQGLEIEPDSARLHVSLAEAYELKGDQTQAGREFAAAVKLDSRNPEMLARYGQYLDAIGRYGEAVEQYTAALDANPARTDLSIAVAQSLASAGDFEKAITTLRDAIQRHDYALDLRLALARVLNKAGQQQASAEEYQSILETWPDRPDIMLELGAVFFQVGQFEQAAEQWGAVVRLQPSHGVAAHNLALAEWRVGRYADAIATLRAYLRLCPDDVTAASALATRLATGPDATLRDGAEAVRLAQHAVSVAGGPRADLLETLASAYAEAGRFDDAVATARQALELARRSGQTSIATRLESRIQLYHQGRSFHQSP